MLSWSTLQSEAQNLVGDTTSAVLTALKRDLNIAIRDIRTRFKGSYVLEDEYTVSTTTTIGQYYPLPADFFKLKAASWKLSNVKYPLIEVQNPLIWEQLNQDTANTGTPPTHCYIRHRAGRDDIGLYPNPGSNSDTNGLLIYYIIDPPDLSVDDSTLTVAGFTNDYETVTPAAAGFTSVMIDDKRWLKPDPATGGDGNWYRMTTFTSTSSIELDRKYEGLTDASVSLTVAQIPLLPKNTDHLPAYFAAAHFFFRKRDFAKGNDMLNFYEKGIAQNVGIWNRKSTQQVGRHGRGSFRLSNPNVPPRGMTSS